MSVWKEIRCDGDPESEDCEDNTNGGPKGFESVTFLHAQARKYGWLVSGGRAVCPACRKLAKAAK